MASSPQAAEPTSVRSRSRVRRRRGRGGGVVFALSAAVPARVLVIADRQDIATLIGRCLVGVGVAPLVATDVRQAGVLVARETPAAVVLDLAAPGHCEAVMQWLRRDPARAAMPIVQVTALARSAPRGDTRADVRVPKPFTPRQIADAVRTVLARRAVRERMVAAAPLRAIG